MLSAIFLKYGKSFICFSPTLRMYQRRSSAVAGIAHLELVQMNTCRKFLTWYAFTPFGSIMIEPKGVNAYQVKNFLHVFICTNSRWAIPATADERRWYILNVGEKHMKDFPYFKKIADNMNDGGRANLLHYLLNLDIS